MLESIASPHRFELAQVRVHHYPIKDTFCLQNQEEERCGSYRVALIRWERDGMARA